MLNSSAVHGFFAGRFGAAKSHATPLGSRLDPLPERAGEDGEGHQAREAGR